MISLIGLYTQGSIHNLAPLVREYLSDKKPEEIPTVWFIKSLPCLLDWVYLSVFFLISSMLQVVEVLLSKVTEEVERRLLIQLEMVCIAYVF